MCEFTAASWRSAREFEGEGGEPRLNSVDSLQLFFLAIIQGLTEFLPVSSSGHLALFEHLLGVPQEARLPVAVFLHFGTLLALLVYFRDEMRLMLRGIFKGDNEGVRLLCYVFLANIATAAIALPLKEKVERAFASPKAVALFLTLTGLLLLVSELATACKGNGQPIVSWRALVVGIAQGLAVFPGLSRSGATISAGLFCGLGREQAGRFAFVVGIPAMLGANLVEAKDIPGLTKELWSFIGAAVIAFGVGLLAIHLTLKAIQSLKLSWFGVYCFLAAVVVFLLL